MLRHAGRLGLLVLTLLFMILNTALAQQRRTALVIGNAAYEAGPLRNPANDATDIAATLQRLGFAPQGWCRPVLFCWTWRASSW